MNRDDYNLMSVEKLKKRGVEIPDSESVYIGHEVKIDRISGDGVVIYPGVRIHGSSTFIDKGSKIGTEGPVTVKDCRLGANVELKSGFYEGSVFLRDVSMGFGSHIREGCLLEEESSAAHTVGLKQTILFPFVTLGSLINFCDCLMSGGTSRKNHSEVGSSYIHFNYTPNQDKATPSLIGDVAKGVMLNNAPIFLGGQGGLVGPRRLAFGTVIAAGTIHRQDVMAPDILIIGEKGKGGQMKNRPGLYFGLKEIIKNNFIYIANLIALKLWYDHVRSLFVSDEFFPDPLFSGARLTLGMAINERLKRLRGLFEKASGAREFLERWQDIENVFMNFREPGEIQYQRDLFLEHIASMISQLGKDYIKVIKNLPEYVSSAGTAWLEGTINMITNKISEIISCKNLFKST